MEQETQEAVETEVIVGQGFSPDIGKLHLEGNRLQLKIYDEIAFDEPIARLGLQWPWYGLGCQFWAHTEKKTTSSA